MGKEERRIHLLISDSFNRFSTVPDKPSKNYQSIRNIIKQLGFSQEYINEGLAYLLFNCQGNQHSTTLITPQHTVQGAVYAGLEYEALHDLQINGIPEILKLPGENIVLTYQDAAKKVRGICEIFTHRWDIIEVNSER